MQKYFLLNCWALLCSRVSICGILFGWIMVSAEQDHCQVVQHIDIYVLLIAKISETVLYHDQVLLLPLHQ